MDTDVTAPGRPDDIQFGTIRQRGGVGLFRRFNYGLIEKSTLHHTNRERRRRGLKRVSGHPALIRAARRHARWMARRRIFSHTGAGGSKPHERAKSAGYPVEAVSENILVSQGTYGVTWSSRFRWRRDWRLGQGAVRLWMNSPGHRENILNPDFNHLGVGVTRNRKGKIYYVQNFGDASIWATKPPFRVLRVVFTIIGFILATIIWSAVCSIPRALI